MTYEFLGQGWIQIAEAAIKTGIDIYVTIQQVNSIVESTQDAAEKITAQYYLSRLLAKAKEIEETQAIADKEKLDKMTSNIMTGGIAALAALLLLQ
jgi:DNA-binding ferritin-like protein